MKFAITFAAIMGIAGNASAASLPDKMWECDYTNFNRAYHFTGADAQKGAQSWLPGAGKSFQMLVKNDQVQIGLEEIETDTNPSLNGSDLKAKFSAAPRTSSGISFLIDVKISLNTATGIGIATTDLRRKGYKNGHIKGYIQCR